MTTLQLDSNNNLLFANTFLLLKDTEALKQDLKTLLLMFAGENPFNLNEGLNYYTLGAFNNKSNLKNAIISRLKEDKRVKAIKEITIKRQNKNSVVDVIIVTQEGELINV